MALKVRVKDLYICVCFEKILFCEGSGYAEGNVKGVKSYTGGLLSDAT